MDKVFITGLTIESTIGVYEWEKSIKQTLVLDIEMLWDNAKAAEADDYQHALCYETVSNALIEQIQSKPIELIETIAEQAATLIMQRFGVTGVKVTVNKPGAVKAAANVGVQIIRGKWL